MSAGYVYFLQAFDHGPIKIGYSANPRKRFGALRTGMFEADRLHGEWFNASLALCTLIEVLIAPDLNDPLHTDVHREIARIEEQWKSERELEEVPA